MCSCARAQTCTAFSLLPPFCPLAISSVFHSLKSSLFFTRGHRLRMKNCEDDTLRGRGKVDTTFSLETCSRSISSPLDIPRHEKAITLLEIFPANVTSTRSHMILVSNFVLARGGTAESCPLQSASLGYFTPLFPRNADFQGKESPL